MKQLQLTFLLLLTGSTLAYAQQEPQQAQVDLPLTVSDGAESFELRFGLDSNATNGRDPGLREVAAPPPPPAGAFFARFIGRELDLFQDYRPCGNNGTCKNFTGTVDYRLGYQLSEKGDQIVISYDLPLFVEGILQDEFGGIVYSCPMSGSGSCPVPNNPDTGQPLVSTLLMRILYTSVRLPVELTSFNAVADGADVVLEWATLGEQNNAGFRVERRSTSSAFVEAGFVPGKGTTSDLQQYSHRVEALASGKHTFRLKQIDFDGGFTYSPEVEVVVELPGLYELSPAYPNPFNPEAQFTLTVKDEQQVTVEVFDALGRRAALLYDGALFAGKDHRFTVNGTGLNSGIYFIRVTGEQFNQTMSAVLLK